jgi:hypothetical protein
MLVPGCNMGCTSPTAQDPLLPIPVADVQVKHLEEEKLQKGTTLENSSFFQNTPRKTSGPSVDDLLPQIVRLWHELHVPLLARSQFLVAHKHREVFFFLAEHAHLLELQKYDSLSTTSIVDSQASA